MQTYTTEILTARLDDNRIRMYELTRLISNCSKDQSDYSDKIAKLDADIDSVTKALESDSESHIEVSRSLNEKMAISYAEKRRVSKLMLISQDLKEEYMYEMHALKEENVDVSYSLEILNEFDLGMKKEPLGVNAIGSSGLS